MEADMLKNIPSCHPSMENMRSLCNPQSIALIGVITFIALSTALQAMDVLGQRGRYLKRRGVI